MTRALAAVAIVCVLAACSSASHSAAVPAPTTAPTSTTTTSVPRAPGLAIVAAAAPAGFAVAGAQWFRVGRAQLVAVFRPRGAGVHPVVVALHGSSGLSILQLVWAQQFAARGYVVVAGCYLDATGGRAFLPCPGLPTSSTIAAAHPGYDSLLSVARGLPGVGPRGLAVVGVSYGAILALSVRQPDVSAIVADSGYGQAGTGVVTAPVLMLGFTDDPNVRHAAVVAFANELVAARRPVVTAFSEGSGHVVTLTPATATASNDRIGGFLAQSRR